MFLPLRREKKKKYRKRYRSISICEVLGFVKFAEVGGE
jgi:hypothetical protein